MSDKFHCPVCEHILEEVDTFQSFPCHFSYADDAPDVMTGTIYECVNEACPEYGAQFYTSDEDPDNLIEGTPYGE